MNTSHAVRDTYNDKKFDNEEPTCDSTLDFQSASPADYQHEVISTMRTTERGMLAISLCRILYLYHMFLYRFESKNYHLQEVTLSWHISLCPEFVHRLYC